MSNLSPAAVPYNSAGTEIATAANPFRVDPTGTTTQPVTQVDRTASGSITANGQSVTLSGVGMSNVGVFITGTWVGTLQFEGTINATDWFSLAAYPIGSNAAGVTSTTANGQWRLLSSGVAQVRVRSSAWTSGTATITLEGNAGSSQTKAAQGAPGDVANAWYQRIVDGTNGPVAVKAASTSAVVEDPSLVVQISPNQVPIPTTVVPPTAIAGSAIGRVSGLSANTFNAVRATTYVEQTTQAQRSIVSTSANDSSAGTGARQVRITYYDATCTGPFFETVTLNGLTAVNTVATNICFIERMDVVSVGSVGANVGTLNLYTGTGATGTIFAAIGLGNVAAGVGDNETFYAHHYVSVGYEVQGYYVSVGIVAAAGGGASVNVIRFRNPTVATSPWMVASDFINAAQGNSASRVYYASIKLPGPLVILGYTTPANNNSTATVSFDYSDEPV